MESLLGALSDRDVAPPIRAAFGLGTSALFLTHGLLTLHRQEELPVVGWTLVGLAAMQLGGASPAERGASAPLLMLSFTERR